MDNGLHHIWNHMRRDVFLKNSENKATQSFKFVFPKDLPTNWANNDSLESSYRVEVGWHECYVHFSLMTSLVKALSWHWTLVQQMPCGYLPLWLVTRRCSLHHHGHQLDDFRQGCPMLPSKYQQHHWRASWTVMHCVPQSSNMCNLNHSQNLHPQVRQVCFQSPVVQVPNWSMKSMLLTCRIWHVVWI